MNTEYDVPICVECGEGRLHRGRLELRALNAQPTIVCWLDPEAYWAPPRCVVVAYWRQDQTAPHEWHLVRRDLRPAIAKLHSEGDLDAIVAFGQKWLDGLRAGTKPIACTGAGGYMSPEGTGMTEAEAKASLSPGRVGN